MTRTVPLLLVIFFCLISCGPVIHYTKLVDESQAAKATDAPITVYLTSKPECSYIELGIVRASNGAFAGGMDTFVAAMKKRAREVGGDAIILREIESRTSGYINVSPGVVAAADGQVQNGIIIQFTNPDCHK